MKKSTKRVIELREKDLEDSKQTKWDVMVPCGLEEFKMIEIVADGWSLQTSGEKEVLIFWKGENIDYGEETAVFNEWIYAIKKPSV